MRCRSQPPRFGAKLRHAGTRAARRPRRTRGCSSSRRTSAAMSAQALPATTSSALSAGATSWVASQAGRGAPQKGHAQKLCCQGAAGSSRALLARPLLVRSTSFGAFGVRLPSLCACATGSMPAPLWQVLRHFRNVGRAQGQCFEGRSDRVLRPRPLLPIRGR